VWTSEQPTPDGNSFAKQGIEARAGRPRGPASPIDIRRAPGAPCIAPAAEPVDESPRGAQADDFVGLICQAIESLSSTGYPDLRATAEFVGLSVRTLQRRLAKAGASHHALVARARFATAAAVLEQTDAKVLELALDLGYSDHGNFTRAFRRWAGCAPREYRLMRRGARRRMRRLPRAGRGATDE
jgi:AraC-like DNA-binding protein